MAREIRLDESAVAGKRCSNTQHHASPQKGAHHLEPVVLWNGISRA